MNAGTLEGFCAITLGICNHLHIFHTCTGQPHPGSAPLRREPVDVGRGQGFGLQTNKKESEWTKKEGDYQTVELIDGWTIQRSN